ncbi:hypothetical protein QBC38DRAFT_471296 [Podospora fimiseda]|uniref:Uncharacterized protein n=1 Tax=Podospora fimiseda TaxID=252190 RepID=A0AAN7H6K9_9PEZI|nr:hypothetical protein QBC38DRAFT_471296 [Podospora fimiseda]
MESSPSFSGPIPMPASPPLPTITTITSIIQTIISIFSATTSIIYTLTITPLLWSIKTSYYLTFLILSPFFSLFYFFFSWIIWPLSILREMFSIIEPLVIFFSNALIIGLITGTSIALIASSLTFFLGFIIPQHRPKNYIPQSSLLSRQQQKSSSSTLQTPNDSEQDDNESFSSDDDPWGTTTTATEKPGAGGKRGGVVVKVLSAPGSPQQGKKKVAVGLLSETIHEEVSDSDGSESSAF